MAHAIPFNAPFIAGKELYYIAKAVQSGHLSGDGHYTKQCHQWLEATLGCHKALLTQSCTAALELAAFLCDLGPEDEVIVPSFTFVTSASAFALRGARLVFVDIRPDTLNMDPRLVEQAVTPRTKVIVPVHYAGVACDMDAIMDIARRHRLRVVEDAAQGVLSRHKTTFLGTIGHMGCLSFHETKNIISGEGGALLINDPELVEQAEIIREKGTNRSQMFRGQVDKYTWLTLGSSFLPSELTAAFLCAQLEQAQNIMARRRALFDLYLSCLKPLADAGRAVLPHVPADCEGNGHMFYLLTRDLDERTRLIAHLATRDIHAVFHYVPLHSSPAGRRHGRCGSSMEVTDNVSERLVRLPLFHELEDQQVIRIAEAVREFYHA